MSHAAALSRAGVPEAERLGTYLDLVARWSRRVNLTGLRTDAERAAVLVAAVAPAAALVEGPRLLDVGSGNGSPGLVLAVLRPDVDVVLLEPRQRRWAFLREAARVVGAGRVEVVRARHDEYRGPACRTLTMRALRLPLLEVAALIAPGGLALLFGGDGGEAAPGFTPLPGTPLPGGGWLRRWRCST